MDNKKNLKSHLNFEKDWKKRFELFARTHDNDAGIAGWSSTSLQVRIRAFLRVWDKNKTGTLWLDAGCGAGTYLNHLIKAGKDVVGVDYSYPTIEKAKHKLGGTAPLAVADVTMLPFANGAFDGAICFGVMQALQRPDAALHRLSRTVQADGEIWIDALNKWCLPNIWTRFIRTIKKQSMHLRYDSPANLIQLAKKLNNKDVELYWLPILPYRLKRFQWLLEAPGFLWIMRNIPLIGLLLSHSFIIRMRPAR
ncbi:MAG: class I SAM-dependent methyltransferase [Gammaproteobacteria bacterium]|nr:class I SAM-dependent methyltransferase [Gammaproteobacteria bacterium]